MWGLCFFPAVLEQNGVLFLLSGGLWFTRVGTRVGRRSLCTMGLVHVRGSACIQTTRTHTHTHTYTQTHRRTHIHAHTICRAMYEFVFQAVYVLVHVLFVCNKRLHVLIVGNQASACFSLLAINLKKQHDI